VDPEDVVQSVFRTAFSRLAKGQFELANWGSLWGLLTRITLRKCGKWIEYYHTGARTLDREMTPAGQASDSSSGWQFLDREPSPSEVMVLAETVEKVMQDLDEREQQIVTLSLQAYSVAEVTRQVGCTQSKVYRILKLIRNRLERARGENGTT
jgi:RNA polymerase sigma-70 factor (ECF subfamily)